MPDTTISAYLIHRLQELGARHVFGVPGDYVLGFYKALEESCLLYTSTIFRQKRFIPISRESELQRASAN